MGQDITSLLLRAANQPAPTATLAPNLTDDICTPLIVRVSRVLDALPAEVKAQGIQLAYVCERLRGANGRKAQAGAVGDCMRTLKWQRRRFWKAGRTGFHARWFPPAGT